MIRLKFALFVLCGFLALSLHTYASSSCKTEIVPPIGDMEAAKVIALASADPSLKDELKNYASQVYRADMNNDGVQENIIALHEGSGGYLTLYIFSEKDGALHLLPKSPPWPFGEKERDGGWYSHESYSAHNRRAELFIKICGKTYISFSGDEPGVRQGFLWQGGKNQRACDPDWTTFLLSDFKSQYDDKLYLAAKANLEGYLKACQSTLPDETQLRILSELSVTAHHLGDQTSCRSYVNRAKARPGFPGSTSRKSLLHNEGICLEKNGPSDFDWLLAPKAADSIGSSDARFSALLAATVPPLDFNRAQFDKRAQSWSDAGITVDGAVGVTHQQGTLRNQVSENLIGPRDGFRVEEGRYAIFSGCRAHSCPDMAMIWVDTKTKKSAFAINDLSVPGADPSKRMTCLAVGSRSLHATELPKEFLSAFNQWKATSGMPSDCRYFIDGTAETIRAELWK